jgi:hypothetical protein
MMARQEPGDWNAVRYDAAKPAGHVESYFLKANSLDGKRACWVKATVFASHARPLQAVAEAWAIFFERDGTHVAVKRSIPFADAVFSRERLGVQVGEHLRLDDGVAQGSIEYGGHTIGLDLKMSGEHAPVPLFGSPAMYSGKFPKQKLVTPRPDLRFEGTVTVDGERVDVSGWRGMQGHNWGRGHSDFYAWGHCNVWERTDDELVLEAASARVKVGPVMTPMVTLVSVRHRGVRYDFTGPLQMLRNRGEVSGRRWHFEAHEGAVRVEADVCAQSSDFVGLYYPNPDGQMTYCLNTKLGTARVRLEVPGRGAMDWITRCAAFEIGTRDPQHGVRMYV